MIHATRPTRRWLMTLAICIAAVVVCMAGVDRPVAGWVHAHLSQTAFFAWTSRALALLYVPLVLMLAVVIFAGARLLAGRRIPGWAELPAVIAAGGAVALAAALAMKHVIGRSSPYPGFVEQHIYEFRPLSNVAGFAAFPSATTAVAAACLAVVWIRLPRFRLACAGFLALIAVALVITNSHWVSDVIGGVVVGGTIGRMSAISKLMKPNTP